MKKLNFNNVAVKAIFNYLIEQPHYSAQEYICRDKAANAINDYYTEYSDELNVLIVNGYLTRYSVPWTNYDPGLSITINDAGTGILINMVYVKINMKGLWHWHQNFIK
jgi:hypothetical protein